MTVRIAQLDHKPQIVPQPLDHGFSEDTPYQVHGWICEAGELQAILVNDEDQVWAISNRHLRAVKEEPGFVKDAHWRKVQIHKDGRPDNVHPDLWKQMQEQGT